MTGTQPLTKVLLLKSSSLPFQRPSTRATAISVSERVWLCPWDLWVVCILPCWQASEHLHQCCTIRRGSSRHWSTTGLCAWSALFLALCQQFPSPAPRSHRSLICRRHLSIRGRPFHWCHLQHTHLCTWNCTQMATGQRSTAQCEKEQVYVDFFQPVKVSVSP